MSITLPKLKPAAELSDELLYATYAMVKDMCIPYLYGTPPRLVPEPLAARRRELGDEIKHRERARRA